MTYSLIPIGLITVFMLYVLYLLLIKKDMKKFKLVFYPGMVFIAIWTVIYFFLLK